MDFSKIDLKDDFLPYIYKELESKGCVPMEFPLYHTRTFTGADMHKAMRLASEITKEAISKHLDSLLAGAELLAFADASKQAYFLSDNLSESEAEKACFELAKSCIEYGIRLLLEKINDSDD